MCKGSESCSTRRGVGRVELGVKFRLVSTGSVVIQLMIRVDSLGFDSARCLMDDDVTAIQWRHNVTRVDRAYFVLLGLATGSF